MPCSAPLEYSSHTHGKHHTAHMYEYPVNMPDPARILLAITASGQPESGRIGSGWPCQVVSKRIRSGSKPVCKNLPARFRPTASGPDRWPDPGRFQIVYWVHNLISTLNHTCRRTQHIHACNRPATHIHYNVLLLFGHFLHFRLLRFPRENQHKSTNECHE